MKNYKIYVTDDIVNKIKDKGFELDFRLGVREDDNDFNEEEFVINPITITCEDPFYSHILNNIFIYSERPTAEEITHWLLKEKNLHVCVLYGEYNDWLVFIDQIKNDELQTLVKFYVGGDYKNALIEGIKKAIELL